MAMNEIGFNQVSTFLNSMVEQATGEKQLAPTDEKEFVSVATTVLKQGYEPFMNALSAVMNRTIFAVRPYSRKFGGINVSEERYGAITRKVSYIDTEFEEDAKFDLVDGQSVDHYEVKKPKVIQLNFYGETIVGKHISIPTQQIDMAVTGSAQFAEFISGVMQNISDKIEQKHETTARATLRNFIAGKIAKNDADSVIHVLSEYNAKTGLSLDAKTLYQPENYAPFIKWLNARIATLSEMMTERSVKFHTNITDKEVMRHTPLEMQKIYLYKPFQEEIKSMALSGLYHDSYINLADFEGVNYWQSIESPMEIDSNCTYLQEDGTLVEGNAKTDKLLGVIFDRDALGYTTVNHTIATTPLNAKGLFYNTWYHFTDKYWNDFTENGIVLLLD